MDISRDPDPKLIIRYDSRGPTFGKVVDSMVKFPDSLFVSYHPPANRYLFIIELNSGRQKLETAKTNSCRLALNS